MLTGAVDALERLLMQQTDKAMTVGHLLHHLHGELVVIGGNVRGGENGSHLVLAGRNLIMFRLRSNTEFPQLLIQIVHERLDTRTDGAEIMILQLLSLRSRRTEQRPAAQNQIQALRIILLVDEEVFCSAPTVVVTRRTSLPKSLRTRHACLLMASMERKSGVFLSRISPV